MDRMKRAAAGALAAMLLLGISACGGKNADAEVAAALEKMKAASSLDAKVETVMSYTGDTEGGDLTATNTMNVTMFSDPLKMKADVEVKMESGGEEYVRSLTTYVIQEGETITQYATDGAAWAKKSAGTGDLTQYDARTSLTQYLAGGTGYKAAGTEQVEGRDAVKYTGTISGEALVQLLEDTSSLNSITSMSADQQAKIKENLKELPPLTINAWVDKENGCPVRYEMDMTKLLADVEANIDATLGHPNGTAAEEPVGTSTYIMKITCTNYGAATAFELPAEAAGAEDVG